MRHKLIVIRKPESEFVNDNQSPQRFTSPFSAIGCHLTDIGFPGGEMKTFSGGLLGMLLFLISACASGVTSAPETTPVTLQMGTTHRASYAGFYAAEQNGNYAQEGLDVTFIEGTPDVDPALAVLDGTAHFGIAGASTLILAQADGQPLRALAMLLRRDPVVYFSLADSGITHLEDFVGKRVYVNVRGRARLYTMLARLGINPDEIIEVNSGDFTALYTGDIDVASGNITRDVLSAQQAGYSVNIIFPDNYGVHFYSTTLFATDDYITANSDVVMRFVRATLQGWTYVVENPQSVGPMVIQYNPEADSAFETASMVASLPYINTGEDYIGWMKPELWEGMAQTMRDEGVLTGPLDITDVYTMEFVQQIYGGANP
jgi:NitT/TauT family transport system substrate-binding protein